LGEHGIGVEGRITHSTEMFLNGGSTLIIYGLLLIMIIVSLYNEPIFIIKEMEGMSSMDLLLNNGTFIRLNTSYDVIDGGGNFGLGEDIYGFLIGSGSS